MLPGRVYYDWRPKIIWSFINWKSLFQASAVSSVQLVLSKSWRVTIKALCMDWKNKIWIFTPFPFIFELVFLLKWLYRNRWPHFSEEKVSATLSLQDSGSDRGVDLTFFQSFVSWLEGMRSQMVTVTICVLFPDFIFQLKTVTRISYGFYAIYWHNHCHSNIQQ